MTYCCEIRNLSDDYLSTREPPDTVMLVALRDGPDGHSSSRPAGSSRTLIRLARDARVTPEATLPRPGGMTPAPPMRRHWSPGCFALSRITVKPERST